MSTVPRIPIDATSEDLFGPLRPDWLGNSHDRDIAEYWIDELQSARAKDAELIQMLVDCIALNYRQNSIDEQKMAMYYAAGGKSQRDALDIASSAGFKPTEP